MGRRNSAAASDDQWLDTATSSRRFPKRGVHSRGGSIGDSSKSTFSVSSIIGTYAIRCPALEKASQRHESNEKAGSPVLGRGDGGFSFGSGGEMTFSVHGLLRTGEDEEEMEALVGSFDWGVLSGMCIIGGSRRGLREAVQAVEEEEEEPEEQEKEHVKYERVYPKQESEDEVDEDDDADEQIERSPTQRPMFEKNTFKNPKFFFEWRGHDALSSSNVSRGPRSDHMGHLEFSNNTCKDFRGTFSSERWGENVAFEGWKVRSKVGECPFTWEEFDE